MKLTLIRHGKTEANEKRLYCGSTDLPLSPAGRAELEGIRYDLGNAPLFTSGMLRAEQTLEILFGDVPHSREPAFREVDFGIFEMKSYDMLKDTPEYQAWLSGNNEENVPPGGESGAQMTARVVAGLSRLPEGAVLVTHGGVIAAIMAYLFPAEGKNRYQWQSPNGHGYVISDNTYTVI